MQGNAHGFDNRAILDALARYPQRLRGVAITDTRIEPETLRDWHRLGMRGLRFHLFSDAGKPGYVRGVGFDVFEVFRKVMAELGWVVQLFCDWRMMAEVAPRLREISRATPVIVDHMLHIPAERGVNDPNFQALLKLVGTGDAYVKVSAPYRLSSQFPDYPDARPFHDALVKANPERLMLGHRLAASLDCRGGDAGRRASAGFVFCLDARRHRAPQDFGRDAGAAVRDVTLGTGRIHGLFQPFSRSPF